MPWRALIRDPDLREVIIEAVKVAAPLLGIWLNRRRLIQLQDHVRCDDECRNGHRKDTTNRRRSLRRRR